VLRLTQLGSPITPSDFQCPVRSKVLHIAPIAAEIGFDLVKTLSTWSDWLSIDPQGMTRRFDKNGYVAAESQLDKNLLPLVRVFKSSVEEIELLTGHDDLTSAIKAIHDYGPEIVIVTEGAKGSVLSNQDTMIHVPACQSRRVVDPTGAGDVYIGAFLAECTRNKEPLWCACVGSAAASLVVEDVGSRFFGEKAEIYSRAKVIYEELVE
jgi:sugar/nucleoside kinase (ribokinase family)